MLDASAIITCPINLYLNGRDDYPIDGETLVESTKNSSSFRLRIGPASAKNISDAFEINFIENRGVIGPKLQNRSSGNRTCHFQSSDELYSAISVCSPDLITGVFRLSRRDTYVLLYDRISGFHLVPQDSETCAFSTSNFSASNRVKRASQFNIPNYYNQYIDDIKRYVELILIADHSVYEKHNKDETKVHDHMQSIANVVNSLYAPLNIRVVLVWADIWKDGNPFEVDENSDTVLGSFLRYRKEKLLIHSHDNAQLLTEVKFANRVIGKAFRGTMCSYDFSGGVIVNDDRIAFVGSTVAHEMGHNFGMEHDLGYPEPCKCAADLCIMSSSSGAIAPTTFWSDCSLDFLSHALKRGADYCLLNAPKTVFGGAKCGNGVVEDGEDCDCGNSECPNKCCIASECKLAPEAECAEGDCCDISTCKPKKMATVCRRSMDTCDLPEFCDGENPKCPADFFVQNGLPCPDAPEDTCYNGYCGSRDHHCQFIWGQSGKNAVPECYFFNQYGSAAGNCGFDQETNTYKRCNIEDTSCGRLQCIHQNERPEFGDPSSVFASYQQVTLQDGKDVACRSIRTTIVGGKQADPGMVADGATCGKDKICVKSKCTNKTLVTEMVSKCDPTNCHDKGICNNVGNCHCRLGYGGTACDIPGYGGSVNSGPASDSAFNPGLVLLYLTIFGLIIFIVATIYCKRRFNIWLHKEVMSSTRKCLKIQSVLVPVRPAPAPPGHRNHRHNPIEAINNLWNRYSNSHQTRPTAATQQQPPQQGNVEVLTVRAAMPVLPHYYSPDSERVEQRDYSNGQNTQSRFNFTAQYESPPPTSKTHIRSDSYKRAHQTPPKVPEHRRLNADSGSSSDETSNPSQVVRPSKAPPPPPIRQQDGSNRPKLPPKPSTHKTVMTEDDTETTQAKVSVKNLAARFDNKLSHV